ncbi:hypothetical protein FRUB_00504 [Fimbriiglobus ruber]|uniref:Uncharacterized protein n=2 Tax=Fimbriiglobus ruber TaxID=1908690 RepID=A0A225EEL6_9BACT|nr:hypothetical protein FRUB_00504 [Fimbriiglobus ruber]
MPHPPLDELVKEYRRHGLPFPPSDAELVILGRPTWDEDRVLTMSYFLAFREPPAKAGGVSKCWIGFRTWDGEDIEEWRIVPAKPVVATLLSNPAVDEFDSLVLAIHCNARGWDALAEALYVRLRKRPGDTASMFDRLHNCAVDYWYPRILERGTDRKEALRRLKELEAKKKPPPNDVRVGQLAKHNKLEQRERLRRLELTVAPRVAKPGTPEALIDQLTDLWRPYEAPAYRETLIESDKACEKLTALGIDAVPALIEHINDERLTRAYYTSTDDLGIHLVDVGQTVSVLLDTLSDFQIGISSREGDRADAKKVKKWLNEVRMTGEEKWLTEHALPSESYTRRDELGSFISDDEKLLKANRIIVRVIGAKYSWRLPELYRTVLTTYPETDSKCYVDEILASDLSRKRKLQLLEEGCSHEFFKHRLYALNGLAQMDPAAYRERVIPLLKPLLTGTETDDRIFLLIGWTDDPVYWDAFAAMVRKSSFSVRAFWLGKLAEEINQNPFRGSALHDSYHWYTNLSLANLSKASRYERLRFLAAFLDDESVDAEDESKTEIRDYLSARLWWRLPILADNGYPVYISPTQDGFFSRLAIRTIVHRVVAEKLASDRK